MYQNRRFGKSALETLKSILDKEKKYIENELCPRTGIIKTEYSNEWLELVNSIEFSYSWVIGDIGSVKLQKKEILKNISLMSILKEFIFENIPNITNQFSSNKDFNSIGPMKICILLSDHDPAIWFINTFNTFNYFSDKLKDKRISCDKYKRRIFIDDGSEIQIINSLNLERMRGQRFDLIIYNSHLNTEKRVMDNILASLNY